MKKNILIRIFLVFGVFFISGVIFSKPLLSGVSRALVYEDPLVKTEAIVVLGGGKGNRIKTATSLYHAGFGEKLFFSGFKTYPGTNTGALMKNYAVRLGVPADKIIVSNPDV
jgi:uncharacterized SAM-binding protein YcdF (DUF218 family)